MVKLTCRSPASTGLLDRLDVQSDLAFDLICLEDLSLHLQWHQKQSKRKHRFPETLSATKNEKQTETLAAPGR